MSLVSHAHTGVFFFGIVWDFKWTRWLFPTQQHSSGIVFKALQWGGDTTGNCHKIYSRLSAASCKYHRLLFFLKKKMFSLYSPDCFSRRRPLHLPDPFSSHRWPRRRKCQLQERQVSLSGYDQHLAEFLFIVHSRSFSSTPACRDISSWNVFSVFLYSWSGQKNSLTYFFISPLQSVFTDGSAPSLVFAHFPS